MRTAARRSGAVPWVAFSSPWEPPRRGALTSALRGFRRLPQRGGDLGARMRRTFLHLLRQGYGGVVLVGGDSPTIPASRLVEACRALRAGADLVLGPARDGGYYLVGLRRDRPPLFRRVAWGTAGVLRTTLRRARRAHLGIRLLKPWYDVDRSADLIRLRRELRGRARRRATRTATLLDALENRLSS